MPFPDLSNWEDFNRIELVTESGLLVVRLVARNKFGEEWPISEAQIPLTALTRDKE